MIFDRELIGKKLTDRYPNTMSAASERVTPSTSVDRVPTGSSNNHLLPPEACHTRPPPNKKTTLPPHRPKCIKCGCPSLCCTQAGFLLWVLLLILIQGGPIAVLYMDHHSSHKYGSTLSRYQTEEGMEPVLCRTVGIYSVNVTGKCQNNLLNQPCLQIRVIVYPSDKIRPIVNATFLVRSEREHVLKKTRNVSRLIYLTISFIPRALCGELAKEKNFFFIQVKSDQFLCMDPFHDLIA